MSRRRAVPRWSLQWIIVMSFSLALMGCPEDPFDPETWIEKLDDPAELDKAITELQRLDDPVAIKPLSKVWQDRGRPQRVLRVIIELAERKKDGGETRWEDALPVLRLAIDDFDVGDAQSMENAKLAADALGRAQDKESIESLVNVVNKPMPRLSPGQAVRRSAIIALGKFGNEPRAVDTLVDVLKQKIAQQPVEIFAAAANALADARSPKAIQPLLDALFRIPPIYDQCRRALVAIGAPVIPELIKTFKGEHEGLNKLAKENEFSTDCNQEMGPESSCKAPTNLQFKAATLLGDMYAEEAVDVLEGGLSDSALPAFFYPNGAPGPTQHAAILDALRKINDQSSESAIAKYWKDSSTDDMIRPSAIDVYSMVSTSTSNLSDLAKLIKDDGQEEPIRMAAGQAYARLVRDDGDYGPLLYMRDRYRKEANKYAKKAKKTQGAFEEAKKEFDKLRKEVKNPKDPKLEKALGKKEEAQQEDRMAQNRVAGYRGFQRAFEQHLARAHTGVTCKQDPKCYAEVLGKDGDAIGKSLSKHITDLDEWSDEEKKALEFAAAERALLELAKMDEKGLPGFDAVMKIVESKERVLRQGAMLAMVHTAKLPCDKCVERLDEIIAAQQEESTLAALTSDTKAVRNYFLWAGKK